MLFGWRESRRRNLEFPMVRFHISSPVKPKKTKCLELIDFLIKRSYCLTSSPCVVSSFGVKVQNHVYSDMPFALVLGDLKVKEAEVENLEWRRGMHTEGRENWDTDPLENVGKHTELTRRLDDQKAGSSSKG